MDREMTASEFARESGVEKRYLTRWAKNGEVDGARQIGGGDKRRGAWLAPRQSWEKAAKQERKPGPKPKQKDPGPR